MILLARTYFYKHLVSDGANFELHIFRLLLPTYLCSSRLRPLTPGLTVGVQCVCYNFRLKQRSTSAIWFHR